MSKSTLEALEKVITKILEPIESKISKVLDRIKKIDEKICLLENKSPTTCSTCNGGNLIDTRNSRPKGSTATKTQEKNGTKTLPKPLTTTMTQKTRRGSLPTTTNVAAAVCPQAGYAAARRASFGERRC
ncbi:hypothetical protein O0L34_g18957 [Tuta absoluta]|nr:hypothetical protein O0L34_g18957 [Tuta absoluta]